MSLHSIDRNNRRYEDRCFEDVKVFDNAGIHVFSKLERFVNSEIVVRNMVEKRHASFAAERHVNMVYSEVLDSVVFYDFNDFSDSEACDLMLELEDAIKRGFAEADTKKYADDGYESEDQ